MTTLNALIVGCGSSFGKELSQQLKYSGYTIYGISGTSSEDSNILKVNWESCSIQDFEKFLRKLPQLDLIIFNQNSPALTKEYLTLNSIDILEVWKRVKIWNQSHYVNCVLPTHILHTLSLTKKLQDHTCVTWILSRSMLEKSTDAPVDYVGQKYQNYNMMKTMALHNPQIFVGICPGKINDLNRYSKASVMIKFLSNVKPDYSGKLFYQNETSITDYVPG